MATRDEWIRVESEDQLRAGMTVEVRTCIWCGRRERMILSSQRHTTGTCLIPGGRVDHPSGIAWTAIGRCRPLEHAVFEFSVREGRVYMLRDATLIDDAEVAGKELERTT